MLSLIKSFARNESGATAIEYGLIAGILGIGIVAGANILKNSVNTNFQKLGGQLMKCNDGTC
ncbi:Flp family type IVb pilin [Alsobacter sp. SYSU BS001988]|jgi:pilus assembly protein Flp/PilA